MSTGLLDRPMTKRTDVPVKVDEEVIRKARIAASYKGVTLAEYLSEALRPIVDRDIEEGHTRLMQGDKALEAGEGSPKRSRRPKG
jgi:hypothetical protein